MKQPIKITKQVISNNLLNNFSEEQENIIDLIMVGYDSLSDKVTDTESKSNPILFRDLMLESLNNFEFVSILDNGGLNIQTPDLDNFDFTNLSIIQQILEGTTGSYIEITHEDLIKITGKTTINSEPIDNSVPLNKRVYLRRYDDFIRRKEREVLNKKLIKFPFSNVPSLEDEVFGPADEYIKDNIDKWINSSIDTGIKKVQNSYKGIK